MRGNTNANISGGGSSKEIKILNVVQTGTLTRDGAVFSGFSSSNYLRLGARVDKGILSLDSSTYAKNFGFAASTADNWEMVWKIKTPNESVFHGPFIDQGGYTNNYFLFGIDSSQNQLYFRFVNGVDGLGSTVLQQNTVYYVKLVFTGSSYNGYLSTTGSFSGEETTEFEVTSMQKIINAGVWNIGHYDNTENLNSSLDLEKCYIKINGEYWWKGVETI